MKSEDSEGIELSKLSEEALSLSHICSLVGCIERDSHVVQIETDEEVKVANKGPHNVENSLCFEE